MLALRGAGMETKQRRKWEILITAKVSVLPADSKSSSIFPSYLLNAGYYQEEN